MPPKLSDDSLEGDMDMHPGDLTKAPHTEDILEEDETTLDDGSYYEVRKKKPKVRSYERYRSTSYAKRNDLMKYCHVCRKKILGKLRVLPSDLKMRRVWILRSNLDAERSAELWLKEMACEGSHGGEFCEAHFPPNTKHMKGSEIIPIDLRPPEGRHTVQEDIQFDFNTIILDCVFCGRTNTLDRMLPFIRNRRKRSLWIDALANDDELVKAKLSQQLKGGVTRFLCDFHISDSLFEINSNGEWRLLKNAHPQPHLVEEDKRGLRTYLVDKSRDGLYWEKEHWRAYEQEHSQHIYHQNEDGDIIEGPYEQDEEYVEEIHPMVDLEEQDPPPQLEKRAMKRRAEEMLQEPSTSQDSQTSEEKVEIKFDEKEDVVEQHEEELMYSDESDVETEHLSKVDGQAYDSRLCQVCGVLTPIEARTMRTWPFDECRHEKWLQTMNWPRDFEDSMRTLWVKRKNECNLSPGSYHFCPINVCQSHIDFRKLPEVIDDWHSVYCVLCDQVLKSSDYLVPFPTSQDERKQWLNCLLPYDHPKLQERKFLWLRERLTRRKPTKYRMCVFHFSKDAFVGDEIRPILNASFKPIPILVDDSDNVERGPSGLVKCTMCDDWKKRDYMRTLDFPKTDAEKNFSIEFLVSADRAVAKRVMESLLKNQKSTVICRAHFSENKAPLDFYAERRLLHQVPAECLVCSKEDVATNMVPFPIDSNPHRQKWINAMCREPWVYRFLCGRLGIQGRHYLCAAHFARNSLRFMSGIGLIVRPGHLPNLVCIDDAERILVWDLHKSKHQYHPIVLEGFDEDPIKEITYTQVVDLLGMPKMREIHDEILVEQTKDAREDSKRRALTSAIHYV